MSTVPTVFFFDRDLSWLSFNERVLEEAHRPEVPLMERINFLSIYSSNLDEFYRVRMPALLMVESLSARHGLKSSLLQKINHTIQSQQERFGRLLLNQLVPDLMEDQVAFLFDKAIPSEIDQEVTNFFFEHVAGYIHLIDLSLDEEFFPENNKLYLIAAVQEKGGKEKQYIINIPTDNLSRFHSLGKGTLKYILFLDDIIKHNLRHLFPSGTCHGCYSFKITRDAELDIKDEFEGNLAKKIEHEIEHRDQGLASRFLFDATMPTPLQFLLKQKLELDEMTMVAGGRYHHLRDLAQLPLKDPKYYYQPWPKQKLEHILTSTSLLKHLRHTDLIVHPPYHTYDTVVRFFNEAAIDPKVSKIYVTLYRIASDSRIAMALINAARNGKKVTVFVELKARFDEANNIKWAKRMKKAGVKILFSIPGLKVHAKVALVKRQQEDCQEYYGLFSTGNFNESTSRFYTDHVLLTTHHEMLKEAEQLFRFLKKRRKPLPKDTINFKHLLVAQFNLQHRFIELIEREIVFAQQGKKATIDIKLNNLEDQVLIEKLYQASQVGVQIRLLVRSICCLVPGIEGMSDTITVHRIVDRYLEHGRVFVFNNDGAPELFMGSSDWMNRNIYRRIEVCVPVLDSTIKKQMLEMLEIQMADNQQSVRLDQEMNNNRLSSNGEREIQSQKAISELLSIA